MEDLDFLKLYAPGNAAITILLPDGTVSKIHGVNTCPLSTKCPLLGYAFDDGPQGERQASIEASSTALVYSFLRYLYTGNYLTEHETEGSCSLLKHAELYKMALDYDVPALEVRAHILFMRDTEMSCYTPTQPVGLCEAIRFVYKHLASQKTIIETLLNYCVSNFKYHRLGEDELFKSVAFELPEFHRALCQTSFQREFQDDGAMDIVRLPVYRSNPRSIMLSDGDLQIDKRTHAEFQFEEWYDSETQGSDMDEKKRLPLPPKERVFKRRRTIDEGDFTLVHRSKDPTNVDVSSESEFSSDTDDDGFQLVHRPKLHIDSVVNSPEAAPSSPESASPPLPVPSVDLLAAIAALRRDSDDEDEDNGASSDWSFV